MGNGEVFVSRIKQEEILCPIESFRLKSVCRY